MAEWQKLKEEGKLEGEEEDEEEDIYADARMVDVSHIFDTKLPVCILLLDRTILCITAVVHFTAHS